MMQDQITAAILAGGKSLRFGSSKYLARFDKKNLIEISIEIASQISNRVIVLSGPERISLPSVIRSYPDIIAEKGPLGGIYTALSVSEREWIAILPVDMPLISPQIYSYLYENSEIDRPVIAVSRSGLEPLVSIWPKSSKEILGELIQSNQLSLWKAIDKLQGKKIDIAADLCKIPQECFFNINTRRDLEQLQHLNTILDQPDSAE